jgi:hypothetical protein
LLIRKRPGKPGRFLFNPELERFLAKRMNATTVELNAGHLSLVSHPQEIADLILAAAGRKK